MNIKKNPDKPLSRKQPETNGYPPEYSAKKAAGTDLCACSATDCTGLIPAGITDEEMLEYYSELYPYLPKAD